MDKMQSYLLLTRRFCGWLNSTSVRLFGRDFIIFSSTFLNIYCFWWLLKCIDRNTWSTLLTSDWTTFLLIDRNFDGYTGFHESMTKTRSTLMALVQLAICKILSHASFLHDWISKWNQCKKTKNKISKFIIFSFSNPLN